MAEIIKHGKYYGNKVTCPHCGCVFIAHPEDYIMSEKRIGGRRIVICPECGRDVTVYGECKPYDWMYNDNTFKIHPEDDPIYTTYTTNKLDDDKMKYYHVHQDKVDLGFNYDYKMPDDLSDYISKVNSIDNYKLPDDYVIPDGYKLVRDCSKCPKAPCFGGNDYPKKGGGYTNCIFEADLERLADNDKLSNYMPGEKKDD